MSLVQIEPEGGFELIIEKPEYIIGKKVELVDGVITSNATISRVHCKIVFRDGQYYICDMGSANGTFINGVKIKEYAELQIQPGDEIGMSNSKFMFNRI